MNEMPGIVIFGRTTEGRLLAEWCSSRRIPALYCAATELGTLSIPDITIQIGRLGFEDMTALLSREKAALVIDATHPYAAEASANIKKAAAELGVKRLRISRPQGDTSACRCFTAEDELVNWLSETEGAVFVTTGLKEAHIFTLVPGFERRVYLRLLPSFEGLKTCLDLGFPSAHIVMMYGPFSRDLNRAMFQSCNARILVTKDSGSHGGFMEKVDAAKDLGMEIALMARPIETGEETFSLEQGIETLEEFMRGLT
jgi:precorrin-6x reductase